VLQGDAPRPGARYASVELLDEDIAATSSAAVKARAGTWRYLAGRFTVRHKLPLALRPPCCDALAGLVVGRPRAARGRGRKGARSAHFASVRQLRQRFIFDVTPRSRTLAGSSRAARCW